MNSADSTDRAFRGGLLVVLLAEAGLVGALHWSAGGTEAIPIGSLADWMRTADPAAALTSVARLVALAIGYWLLLTTVVYALAHQLGWVGVTEAMRWITLPVVRRVVHGVTAVSLTSAAILGPAVVSVGPAFAQEDAVVADGDETDTTVEDQPSDGYVPDAAGWPEVEASGDFWRPTVVEMPQAASAFHAVSDGDSMWTIARDHLRSTVGREITEDELSHYWARLVEANRDTIQSGDPDMIFPAERITLPDVFGE